MNAKLNHLNATSLGVAPRCHREADNRGFARIPLSARACYRYDEAGAGHAHIHDFGRGGLRMRMGRYLRPGTKVRVRLEAPETGMGPIEFMTHIAWCAPVSETPEFDAGLRILHDGGKSLAQASALVHAALLCAGRLCTPQARRTMDSEKTVTPVWRCDAAHAGDTLQFGM